MFSFSALFARLSVLTGLLLLSCTVKAAPAAADTTGLLFYLSGETGFRADYAAGNPKPNYRNNVGLIPDGRIGKGIRCEGHQLLSYWAPGNIYARRGTLSFYWRPGEPYGKTAFPIFRVGYADHSSWDMVWLRIDYNGAGFDAFVTDVNLARVRVSYCPTVLPPPDRWLHFALTWDETQGIRFYLDGEKIGRRDSVVLLDTGLDQFGPHSRIISPYQVQSAYNFIRGGDIDELRIYDRALDDATVRTLAAGQVPEALSPSYPGPDAAAQRREWLARYGWEGELPPVLEQERTTVRKVQINEAYDIKRWWWKACDGIRETTWPGVYNRSRIPGRNDYFQLPDWDCYSVSGRRVRFNLPDEPWNRIEVCGGAGGRISRTASPDGAGGETIFRRSAGVERSFHRLNEPVNGETLVFTNDVQESPLGEFNVFYVHEGDAPQGTATLSYVLTSRGNAANPNLDELTEFIRGRYPAEERSTLVAVPARLPIVPTSGGRRAALRAQDEGKAPLIHLLIPGDFRSGAGLLVSEFDESRLPRFLSYTWMNMNAGLDGIRIELPALQAEPLRDGLFPLNIRVKDPLWPLRDMLDFSFSVRPGQPRVLWLDLRDRILPGNKPLYLTVAGGPGLTPDMLEGMRVELVFKNRKEAETEHIADRFTQVRDNYAMICEEAPNNRRLRKYVQFETDMTDLLRVAPDHRPGLNYWYVYNSEQAKPGFVQPEAPAGVPLWAFRQLEALRGYRRMVQWYIDNRQIANGEFGGGISDDTDLGNWFPGLALMGVMPDRIGESLERLTQAVYDNGTLTGGLPAIQTDGLHTFEEGGNTVCQMNLLRIGDPKQVERMMEIAHATREKIIGVNRAGHTHFRTDYFSATKIAEEDPWAWSSPRQSLHLIPFIYLAEFYGNETARKTVIDMADGYLAHARTTADGKLVVDSEINFNTDESRPSGMGNSTPVFWAAWRWTGNPKYLRPILDRGISGLGSVTSNALDIAGLRETLGREIAETVRPDAGSDVMRHLAWQVTGDKRYLEAYYADQIEQNAIREYINTEGSVWIDRLVLPPGELQRSRLGGIALTRSQFYPGNAVSWRFDDPEQAERVAILVPQSAPREIRIEAFNTADSPVTAVLTGWDVLGGTWEIVQEEETPEGGKSVPVKRRMEFGRNRSVPVAFPARRTTFITLRLVGKGVDYAGRPELGIGPEDIRVSDDGRIRVTVHSLGGVAAKGATLALVTADGKTVSYTGIPALGAPVDLLPKTAEVALTVPTGTALTECTVCIDPENRLSEITRANNSVALRTVVR